MRKQNSLGRSKTASANLSISVTKEDRLTGYPVSPKRGPRSVWGRTARRERARLSVPARSPQDTRERMHSRFQKLFGTRGPIRAVSSGEKKTSNDEDDDAEEGGMGRRNSCPLP